MIAAGATILLVVQITTFVALGGIFIATGHLRLGIAQILLAMVQAVIYSEGIVK